MAMRFTSREKALLEALLLDERTKLESHGILPEVAARVGAVDILRALVRQEALRRGLLADDLQPGAE